MAKSTKTVEVTAARVREAYNEGLFEAPVEALPSLIGGSLRKVDGEVQHVPSETGNVRGRLNPAAVEAFNAARKGKEVYGGENRADLSSKTIEVPMFSAKTGRPVKPLTKTVAEVRAAAGIEGKAGRISRDDLRRAALAFGSGEPKE